MSDAPKQPTPPATDDAREAKPAGVGKLPSNQLTLSQHIFIWALIIVVGVLFGMGSTVPLLNAPTRTVAGISEGEVLPRQETARRLEAALNPDRRYPEFEIPPYDRYGRPINQFEEYARQLRQARIAEAEGLSPEGAALDRIEAAFLATPLKDHPNRTYRDALLEHIGGQGEVSRTELRRFLAERHARDALIARHIITPAVAPAAGAEVASAYGDRAELIEVTLTGRHLLPAVPADDPEIVTTFERLRGQKFTRPASATILAAAADRAAFEAGIALDDAATRAWYDAHPDAFPGDAPPVPPATKPAAKPYEAVKDEIATRIRAERSEAESQRLADALNQIIEDEGLDGDKEPAGFRAAAAKVGIAVSELTVEEQTGGRLGLGALGGCQDVVRLFSKEHETGFVSRPIRTDSGNWVVLRLAERSEAGFKPLDEVKPEVIAHLAGQRAWKRVLDEAGKVRDELAKAGPDGLKNWAASDAGKAWEALSATPTRRVLDRLPSPPAEADGQPGDPILVASLTTPEHPIALVSAPAAGSVPRIKLVQVVAVKPAPIDAERLAAHAGYYRQMLRGFRGEQWFTELRGQMEDR